MTELTCRADTYLAAHPGMRKPSRDGGLARDGLL